MNEENPYRSPHAPSESRRVIDPVAKKVALLFALFYLLPMVLMIVVNWFLRGP